MALLTITTNDESVKRCSEVPAQSSSLSASVIPDEVDVKQVRVKYGIRLIMGTDPRAWLPLEGLPLVEHDAVDRTKQAALSAPLADQAAYEARAHQSSVTQFKVDQAIYRVRSIRVR